MRQKKLFNIKFDVEDFFLTIKAEKDDDSLFRDQSSISESAQERRQIILQGKLKAQNSVNWVYKFMFYFTVGFYQIAYYYTG